MGMKTMQTKISMMNRIVPGLWVLMSSGFREAERFLAGTYRQICMSEAEFLMSHESMDHYAC
jgi:hypothetical protein